MRVSVVFEGSCKTLHMSPHQTVANIKNMIQQSFYMLLSGVDQVQCVLEEVQKVVLRVFSAITKETFPLSGAVIVLSSCSVSTLMSLVSLKLGVPVSAFRLFTVTRCPLYDCNLLCDYHLTPGDTHLETWNGWNEFLRACLRGHKHTLQLHLFQEKPILRFQKRVALYIAAAHRHLDMASWLMDTGVKAEDFVGVHPYRMWCYKTEHLDSLKCPVHAAAEAGQLLILKLFISRSAENLTCRDPSDQNVLRIAIKHRHRECVTYLVSKLCTTLNFSGCSLPMNIYLQIKLWIRKARRRQSPFVSRIGDAVQVDGVPMKKTSLHPRCRAVRGCVEVKRSPCGFEMTSPFVGSSCLSHHPAASPSHNASVKLPQLHPPHTPKSKRREQNVTRSRACGRKSPEEILPAEKSHALSQRSRGSSSSL
ncbi:putative protein ANKUB1 [Triplophysa rosa]|uniref:Protein ANKUB1 n=1 Tax=Triplophysa rosa TaxID=992332 RepID=A0A9W7W9X9_TRIRA|nr:putative protein ANKUB1 [Triplophysa rosa]